MPRLRLGAVAYLNAVPLVDDLRNDPDIELQSGTPAAIADRLAAGRLDLGLVPVFEAARLGLHSVPDIGIVARGAVESVLLLSRGPIRDARQVALDPASRSSACLTRILFDRAGLAPRFRLPAPGEPFPAAGDDAWLQIGDPALTLDCTALEVIDLGQWWLAETGLPFVFARWSGPDPGQVANAAERLRRARDRGLARLAELARREGPPRGIPAERALAYLSRAVAFTVGPPEEAGLTLYLERARALGLLPPGRPAKSPPPARPARLPGPGR